MTDDPRGGADTENGTTETFGGLSATVCGVSAGISVTILLDGELDLGNAGLFQSLLDRASALWPDRLVIDIAGLWFIDAHGLRVIAGTATNLQSRGGVVHVVGAGAFHRRLFEVIGLEDLLD